MNLERIIEFKPAYDKRDLDPKKNYGIHGIEMRWYVKGPLGVVQWVVYTNWMLDSVDKSNWPQSLQEPMAADLGYHSPKPMYEDQRLMTPCQFFAEGCYYDGSSLAADTVLDILKKEGGEAVWKYLENYYLDTFEEAA